MLTADVTRWKQRIAELNELIFKSNQELEELEKKVTAAAVLLGPTGTSETDSDAANLRKLIKTLMADGQIRKPRDIRQALINRGVNADLISSRSGNFYNAIARLVAEGDLKKDDESRYWNPEKSSGPTSSVMEDMLK
ncbi:hypothetical protein SSBR45G_55140 [Bradyrhizobium sp. SSBR45G]|uniref:hypothetical protein n=1 Tax=unclassified Bradyrhizobium TaxID=2631580 RepID=UPI002342B0F0|nr:MULTISPECIES: hypothetical protein [unclassified Bradyrhizobium]GLH80605.1 hypothetical protein SSBR45G_55140 [Bradyrhizobium sp. SSBR45G]GLH85811.1 hypothetical protein SSBR45R_32710 [Bradyrhizobium sp. SSBR45R]